MTYDRRLTSDIPSINRGSRASEKKGLFRRLAPYLFILCAGVLGFLVPTLQKSESTASNDTVEPKQEQQTAPEPIYESKTYAVVKSNDLGYLNVREQASTTSTKLGQLSIGDKVEVLSEQGTWVQVKLNSPLGGKESGWVAAEYVDVVTERVQVN